MEKVSANLELADVPALLAVTTMQGFAEIINQ